MTENKQCRDAFEVWYVDPDCKISQRALRRSDENPEGYALMQAQSSWTAWKAAWQARHNEAPTGEIGELIERIGYEITMEGYRGCNHNSILEDCKAQLQQAEALKAKFIKQEYEIQQILGKALGFPWYKDDKAIFPDATEDDSVCVGEHIAITLTMEAASKLQQAQKMRAALEDIYNAATYADNWNMSDIRKVAKQALNNEG